VEKLERTVRGKAGIEKNKPDEVGKVTAMEKMTNEERGHEAWVVEGRKSPKKKVGKR